MCVSTHDRDYMDEYEVLCRSLPEAHQLLVRRNVFVTTYIVDGVTYGGTIIAPTQADAIDYITRRNRGEVIEGVLVQCVSSNIPTTYGDVADVSKLLSVEDCYDSSTKTRH